MFSLLPVAELPLNMTWTDNDTLRPFGRGWIYCS